MEQDFDVKDKSRRRKVYGLWALIGISLAISLGLKWREQTKNYQEGLDENLRREEACAYLEKYKGYSFADRILSLPDYIVNRGNCSDRENNTDDNKNNRGN